MNAIEFAGAKDATMWYIGVCGQLSGGGGDPANRPIAMPRRTLPPCSKTSFIEMWDPHWCQAYAARVANMVPR